MNSTEGVRVCVRLSNCFHKVQVNKISEQSEHGMQLSQSFSLGE